MVTHRRLAPKADEFYVTPAWGTRALLHYELFPGTTLEPCCGDGAMARVLKEKLKKVSASDLHDRGGYGSQRDFFSVTKAYDNVITNPPFNIAEEIFAHAYHNVAQQKVALLLRTAFVEGGRRWERIFSKTPPTRVWVFSRRLSIFPAGDERTGGGTTSYSWFVWEKPIDWQTQLKWIDPNLYEQFNYANPSR